ncbi:hypothetical protein [Azospirillum sp. sgz301742]
MKVAIEVTKPNGETAVHTFDCSRYKAAAYKSWSDARLQDAHRQITQVYAIQNGYVPSPQEYARIMMALDARGHSLDLDGEIDGDDTRYAGLKYKLRKAG